MNKTVLIVTPFFAPQTHAAVFRAYKLAKYLPQFGWKPYVLTVDTNYNYNEDPRLLAALPQEVEIHKARYIEPTLRGLRMALGGRNRTFLALNHEILTTDGKGAPDGAAQGTASRLYNSVLERWLRNPDSYWTWYGTALRMGKRLIRQHKIPLVFTSADPYTCHRIGRQLQQFGCNWVADLRDPHAYARRTSSPVARVYCRQRDAERTAVTGADAVTVASGAIGMILTDMYGLRDSSRVHFIPTGVDEALLPQDRGDEAGRKPWLVFSGEYLPEYGTEFLEVFARAVRQPDVEGRGIKLVFIGRLEINQRLVLPIVQRLGIEDRVQFLDHMPQEKLYTLLRDAQAAVLISSRLFGWWCLHAKLVDYIALRKHVVALVPDPSEARTRLTKAGLGVFLDGDQDACVRMLTDFLLGRLALPTPDVEECGRYTAQRQVEEFVKVFESVAGIAPHGVV
jgi:glycosyltransferase involved in cell wall biosynthesis